MNHFCRRCGYETRCPHGWPDRHPAATVILAVTALIGVTAHPWLLAPIVVAVVAYLVDRQHRRHDALAARADWEHAQLMAQPVHVAYNRGTRTATVTPHQPHTPAPWHLVSLLPTTPIGRQ